MVIYKATNIINGKEYVGQTIRGFSERIKEHKYCASKRTRNLPLYNAINKYGFENFEFAVIDSASSIEELNKKEEQYIRELNSLWPNGYNMMTGGHNSVLNEFSKKKMSDAKKGKPMPEKCREMGILANKGIKRSEETRKKMSEAQIGEKNHRFGKPSFNRGKTFSQETCKKISESKKGKGLNNNNASKKVICLDNGIIYDSAVHAAKELSISKSGVAQVASGIYKQMKGFRFKYL